MDAHTQALGQIFAGDGPGSYSHDRLACRRAPAAAVVAEAVLVLVGIVRVPGAETVLDLVVVARARVSVLDEDADRRAGGSSLEHTRQDTHLITFAPLADEVRG